MEDAINPELNYKATQEKTGYVRRCDATRQIYADLGFKCGLEIHQQLLTQKKLFCRCPAGIYQEKDEFDAEVIRHMRPTLSELGEYDGTALMEFKTRKNIIYRIADETACTYDIDDTPPFPINRDALDIAIEVALLLKTNIVGELHITRKQYLDGSIPTGFQRTAIVGIEGEIPLSKKKVRIRQITIEEDACRETSDEGHWRIYTTDRLGMPLIEPVTYPDMVTPDEAEEAGQYLRYLARSTGKMRTGIGAGRQDVNVSITGGERVEIKGVAHISWIPELTHNEAFRQKALLLIRDELIKRGASPDTWKLSSAILKPGMLRINSGVLAAVWRRGGQLLAVNLPHFKGLLSHFTQPGQTFADEISGRLKVIACLEKPNMIHSEQYHPDDDNNVNNEINWDEIRRMLAAGQDDAQLIFWGPDDDIKTALETIEERGQIALMGIPNETRKSLSDGTTIFERVLPGPDRMYPDTDSAPLSIADEKIEEIRARLPLAVSDRINQLRDWKIPEDTYSYLLRHNLVWIVEKIVTDFGFDPKLVGTLFGHTLRHVETRIKAAREFKYYTMYGLFKFIHQRGLEPTIAKAMIPELYAHPQMVFDSVLTAISYKKRSVDDIKSQLPELENKFAEIGKSDKARAKIDWIMGYLRPLALGNMPLKELRREVEGGK